MAKANVTGIVTKPDCGSCKWFDDEYHCNANPPHAVVDFRRGCTVYERPIVARAHPGCRHWGAK